MPSAMVLLATGAEEMETVITTDILRRAGIDVTVAGVMGNDPVVCSRKVCIKPDKSLDEASKGTYDVVVCPGGLEGAKNLSESEIVGKVLKAQEARDGFLAAICAGPTAFKAHGIGINKSLTSHPIVSEQFEKQYKYRDDLRVVRDGKLITSRGPGTTFEFALEIVKAVQGEEKVKEITPPMLLPKFQ